MSATTTRQYTPTGPELADAVSSCVKSAQGTPSVKVLTKALEQKNPRWKLPERRIAKFLKKDRKSTGLSVAGGLVASKDNDDDDVSVSSTSSFVKKAGTSLKNIFSGKEDAIQSPNEKLGFFRSPLKSFRNKKQEKKKLAVQAKVVSALVVVPIVTGEKDAQPSQKEEPPTLLLPAEPEAPDENISPLDAVCKDVVYHDDNDGQHEATLCGGCIIL